MNTTPALTIVPPAPLESVELIADGIHRTIDGLSLTIAADGLHIQGLSSANSSRKKSVWIDTYDVMALLTFLDTSGVRAIVEAHWLDFQQRMYLEAFSEGEQTA